MEDIDPPGAAPAGEKAGRLAEHALAQPEDAATAVAGRAAGLLGGAVGVVWLLAPGGRIVRVAGVAAADPRVGERLAGRLVGTPVALEAAGPVGEAVGGGHPTDGPVDARRRRTRTLRTVPVRVAGEIIGALSVIDRPGGGGRAGLEHDLADLAERSAVALAIVRQHEHYARRSRQTQILITWSQAAASPDGPSDAALGAALDAMASLVRARCWVIGPDGEQGPAAMPAQDAGERGRGPTTWFPLHAQAQDFGRLAAQRPAPFDEEETWFLSTLALTVALARQTQAAARARQAVTVALRLSEERFRLAFDEAPVGVALVELQGPRAGTLVECNAALLELAGLTREAALGLRYGDLVRSDDREADRILIDAFARGEPAAEDRERRLVRPDGRMIWVQTRLGVVRRRGQPWRLIAHVQDITARKVAQEQLEHQAVHDGLTGLGNRARLLDHLRTELARLDRTPAVVAVLYLDLDRFKAVNDTRGHAAGDAVLRQVADRLARVVPPPDAVSRIAGDEFAVAATVDDEADAALLAERLQQSLGEPFALDGEQVPMTASLGLAFTTSSAADPADLVREADLAMYHAKHDPRRDAGPDGARRWHVYHGGLAEHVRHLDEVLRLLHAAPAAGWLRLAFQPIVELGSGRLVAAEALLRIAHPQRGLLYPAEFIDVAERDDVILPIGQWVLSEALRHLRDWRRDFGLELGVNVSGRQVTRRVIESQIRTAAEQAGYAGGEPLEGLRLEVTERVALEADDDVVLDLRRLSGLGVRLALDDFGTGYASLLHLRRLPVDELKIDGSFVSGLGRDADDSAIVRGITALAGSLGLGTVAEGVERPEQVRLLRELGCARAQGYLLGVPMGADELTRRLAAEATGTGGALGQTTPPSFPSAFGPATPRL